MAKVYIGDYIEELDSGLPGRVTSLQPAHLNASMAGGTGTRQFTYDQVRLISEPDEATKEAIDSTVLEQHPANTVSPVPRDMPTIGEVFPDLAASAALEPGTSTAIDVAHPDPALVGTGLFQIEGPDGRVLAYLRSVTRERNERAQLAHEVAERREAERLADEHLEPGDTAASVQKAENDETRERWAKEEAPERGNEDEEARDAATSDAPSTPLFGGEEQHADETPVTEPAVEERSSEPETLEPASEQVSQPEPQVVGQVSDGVETAPAPGTNVQYDQGDQPQVVDTPTEQAVVEPVSEAPADEPAPEPAELDADEQAEVAQVASDTVEASQSSEPSPTEDKVLTETAERLDESKPDKPADYSDLGFRDLQKAARERGLRSGGSAEVLRARLIEFDAQASAKANAE